MNKKTVVFCIAILLAIGGGSAYLLASNDGKSAKQAMVSKSTDNQLTSQNSSKPQNNNTPGTYIDYKDGVVADTKGTKLLFFHAPWCPQCRQIESDIKQNGVPSGVTIIKVDYDSSRELKQKYDVTLQTTFVKIEDSGDLVKKYVAYDEPTLDSVVKNLL